MHDAQSLNQTEQSDLRTPALPFRGDTLLGVCEAIGEDFGLNPLWLRIALAAGLLWNPTAIVGIYVGLGVVVLASRLIFPKPRQPAPVASVAAKQPATPEPLPVEEQEPELIAA